MTLEFHSPVVGATLVEKTGEDAVKTSRLTFGLVAVVAAVIVTGVLQFVCQVQGVPLDAPLQAGLCLGVAGGVMWLGDALGLMQAARVPFADSVLAGRHRK